MNSARSPSLWDLAVLSLEMCASGDQETYLAVTRNGENDALSGASIG
jgi:hypothetical protein